MWTHFQGLFDSCRFRDRLFDAVQWVPHKSREIFGLNTRICGQTFFSSHFGVDGVDVSSLLFCVELHVFVWQLNTGLDENFSLLIADHSREMGEESGGRTSHVVWFHS